MNTTLYETIQATRGVRVQVRAHGRNLRLVVDDGKTLRYVDLDRFHAGRLFDAIHGEDATVRDVMNRIVTVTLRGGNVTLAAKTDEGAMTVTLDRSDAVRLGYALREWMVRGGEDGR